jgi:hypothetical protein
MQKGGRRSDGSFRLHRMMQAAGWREKNESFSLSAILPDVMRFEHRIAEA